MEMKTNETYKRLELERINTVMILQRLQKSTSDDPVKVQSHLQLTIKLQRIEAALARQKSQDYGICITCKNAIDPERLEALPYAEHCLSCQRQLEKNQLGPRRQSSISYRGYH